MHLEFLNYYNSIHPTQPHQPNPLHSSANLPTSQPTNQPPPLPSLPQAKPAAGAAPSQQDLFRQLMRARLPPLQFFVEQMAEGVLKPDTWGAPDDPMGEMTEDEEAEEFAHM